MKTLSKQFYETLLGAFAGGIMALLFCKYVLLMNL